MCWIACLSDRFWWDLNVTNCKKLAPQEKKRHNSFVAKVGKIIWTIAFGDACCRTPTMKKHSNAQRHFSKLNNIISCTQIYSIYFSLKIKANQIFVAHCNYLSLQCDIAIISNINYTDFRLCSAMNIPVLRITKMYSNNDLNSSKRYNFFPTTYWAQEKSILLETVCSWFHTCLHETGLSSWISWEK